ncbi:MAG: ABC transporter ATP-binding protein [Ruminococcus sp.]|nr:ABC transporter ATP-binding protein [Ruminococcus sp.]
MNDLILKATDLSKSFSHNGEQVHVLSHIDMVVEKGSFTVIMGASGSGKSTLLYALSGMDKATAGKVIYNGTDLTSLSESRLAALRRRDFGFIFQQMHLVSNLTLFENVAVSGYLDKKVSASEVKRHANELLDSMGLSEVKDHRPAQVSGGEQQRCAIARAVINTPEIVFADEPTGSLNRRNSIEVLDMLSGLNNKGQTILMVTHDLKAALRADRLLYLDDGKISGTLELAAYNETDEKSREKQVNAWLASLDW